MCQDFNYIKMTTKTTTKSTQNSTENLYMHLNASELTAIIMKGSPNSNDRDAGFCSGSSEGGDDLSVDHSRLDPCSPANASEDSVEVKVTPISLVRNKRKSSEPSKVICEREESAIACGPLKKRIRYTSSADSGVVLIPPIVSITTAPTPPPAPQTWDSSQALPHELMPNPAQVFVRHPGVTTLHRLPQSATATAAAAAAAAPSIPPTVPAAADYEQIEPLALVAKKPKAFNEDLCEAATADKHLQLASSKEDYAPTPSTSSSPSPADMQPAARAHTADSLAAAMALNDNESTTTTATTTTAKNSSTRPQQRNYKNMTRERRIEANARERTRVHTISAAYETLRRAVPSYSNAQKLSKLSVLRVACSYILTLSRMAGHDYTEDQTAPSIASCIDAVTATIQTEGKIRKKKDE